MARAEADLLRATVERHKRQIQGLEGRVVELTKQLELLGVEPAGATTKPASDGRPKRVVFVVDSYMLASASRSTTEEVSKAIGELDAGQWFNVIIQPGNDPIPLGKTFLAPTAENRKRAEELLRRGYMGGNSGIAALTLACQWRPDRVWYVGRGGPYPEKFETEAAAVVAKAKVRVDTTTHFTEPYQTTIRHALWRLAHDSGGRCLDDEGRETAEPPMPVKVELPKAPAPVRPSVLKGGIGMNGGLGAPAASGARVTRIPFPLFASGSEAVPLPFRIHPFSFFESFVGGRRDISDRERGCCRTRFASESAKRVDHGWLGCGRGRIGRGRRRSILVCSRGGRTYWECRGRCAR